MASVIGSKEPKPWKRIRPYEALFNHFKSIMRGFQEVALTYEEFLEFMETPFCVYCGDPVKWTQHNVGKYGAATNLDRKDSSKGYSKENCVVCCRTCNLVKSNVFTFDEFCVMMLALKAFRASGVSGSSDSARKQTAMAA